jgi:hypothetical protein
MKDAKENVKMIYELPHNKLRKKENIMIKKSNFDKNMKKEGNPLKK